VVHYELDGKVALVTGAGSGIGRAVALTLARSGAAVAVADLAEEKAQAVAAEITGAGGRALAFGGDSSDPDAVDTLVADVVTQLGGLHVAVNNAGIGGPAQTVDEYSTADWRKVLSVNLDGVFYGVRAETRAMLAGGGGSIINMASVFGAVGIETAPAYVAAKHGVVGLTKAAALAHATEGIRVNAVGPAFISTPLLVSSMSEEARAGLASQHALGRLGTPEEVAELVAWLASDASSFATGTYYPLDGGLLAR
jgi:NAD(P)-dependent dehydrogenase (short-subunit alcohol dehydrogenase family)